MPILQKPTTNRADNVSNPEVPTVKAGTKNQHPQPSGKENKKVPVMKKSDMAAKIAELQG